MPDPAAPNAARNTALPWIAGLTVAIEAITCVLRFGSGLESTKDTTVVGAYTFGIRIHHGYIGLLVLAAWWLTPARVAWRPWLLRAGAALFLSDMIHHFLVLWPITGHHDFDLTYPGDVGG